MNELQKTNSAQSQISVFEARKTPEMPQSLLPVTLAQPADDNPTMAVFQRSALAWEEWTLELATLIVKKFGHDKRKSGDDKTNDVEAINNILKDHKWKHYRKAEVEEAARLWATGQLFTAGDKVEFFSEQKWGLAMNEYEMVIKRRAFAKVAQKEEALDPTRQGESETSLAEEVARKVDFSKLPDSYFETITHQLNEKVRECIELNQECLWIDNGGAVFELLSRIGLFPFDAKKKWDIYNREVITTLALMRNSDKKEFRDSARQYDEHAEKHNGAALKNLVFDKTTSRIRHALTKQAINTMAKGRKISYYNAFDESLTLVDLE